MMTNDLKYAGGVLAVIAIVALLSKTATTSLNGTNDATRKNIKNLVKQSQYWHTVAAQNTNPLLQLLHTSKALAYAKIARKLATEREVNKITGTDINELIYDLEIAESKGLQYLSQKFPELAVGTALASGWV